MNDDSAPDHSLPLFLSSDAEETGQRGSFRVVRTGLLLLTALVVSGATLLLGGPGSRITALTASITGASAPATNHDETAPPPAQPIVEAQATPPAETAAPSEQQPATAAPEPAASEPVASEPAEPKQADATIDRDALFRQFQAWARQQDSKPDQQQSSGQDNEAPATPAASAPPAPPQPVADTTRSVATRVEPKAPAPAVQAPVRAAQKQRPARELRNARAEIERRAKEKASQTYWTPPEEARAPETPAQSPDTPWLLKLFGGHN